MMDPIVLLTFSGIYGNFMEFHMFHMEHLGSSINGGAPNWMVYHGKSH